MRAASRSGSLGADLDAKHLAVGAEQRGLQQPRAFAAPLQQCAELCGELLDGAEHVALERDRLGEALLGDARPEPAGAA